MVRVSRRVNPADNLLVHAAIPKKATAHLLSRYLLGIYIRSPLRTSDVCSKRFLLQ